jgi:glycosyltransferase involved in cell wall biosynthesis
MKLAFVVPGGVDRGGQERVAPVLLWLIERLARHHHVLVIALNQEARPAQYELLGAQVTNLGLLPPPWGKTTILQQMQHARQLIATLAAQRQRIDVLHALWLGATGWMTALAGHLLHIPTVLSIGGGELVWLPQIQFGVQRRWHQRMRMTLALRLATTVTVGSHYAAQPLPAWRRPVHWVPLGVDPAAFVAPVERPPGPPWRLLQVASINRVKDPFTLLQALQLVHTQMPGVRLDWVGEDTLSGAAQRYAAQLGIAQQVTFHGFQPSSTVGYFMRQAHLYVQSSQHEGQGVAVLEAAAAALPTVGTAVGLVAELAPSAAYAIPPGDPQALATGVLELLTQSAQRERIGRAAQTWAHTYDADWTARQFTALYGQVSVLNKRKRVHPKF